MMTFPGGNPLRPIARRATLLELTPPFVDIDREED